MQILNSEYLIKTTAKENLIQLKVIVNVSGIESYNKESGILSGIKYP